jgi:hypothetical protein
MTGTPITYGQICKDIAAAMATANLAKAVQAYDQITEGIPITPLIQVYADSGEVDTSGRNDRTTFKAGVRQTLFTVIFDGYARTRSQLQVDLKEQMALIDAIDAWLNTQAGEPIMGTSGIRALHWRWERTTFSRGEGQSAISYAGCRFTVDCWIY